MKALYNYATKSVIGLAEMAMLTRQQAAPAMTLATIIMKTQRSVQYVGKRLYQE
eukprot:CAMPEP_0194730012 /NCGR_PEP_ID=MMETSP0296-20130528/50429_1 /TAXON_ID=39354 /ORGANISM="Heterosigma akashiwo, Strain CCMP2393" /LENGTH=53 /DNA_ID=CAMNT_0039636835 /DNA_START=142 /DNA_END=300 /DNA_ORIENTATION=+